MRGESASYQLGPSVSNCMSVSFVPILTPPGTRRRALNLHSHTSTRFHAHSTARTTNFTGAIPSHLLFCRRMRCRFSLPALCSCQIELDWSGRQKGNKLYKHSETIHIWLILFSWFIPFLEYQINTVFYHALKAGFYPFFFRKPLQSEASPASFSSHLRSSSR